MLCRNCNYILSGEEDFCPHCGQATKTQETEITKEDIDLSQNVTDLPKASKSSSIFDSDTVIVTSEEEPLQKNKSGRKAAITLVSMLVFVLIIIAAYTAAEYFDLAPAFSSFISQQASTSAEPETTIQTELSGTEGLLPPEINYKPALCTVISQKSLPLRKGPGDSYAPLGSVQGGTRLQITGGSLDSDIWVYVYVPSMDVYGWLSASYLTTDAALDSTTLPSQQETSESTSAETDESKKSEESKQTLSEGSYRAKVTAEKGLYMRVGPGVDFEAVTVIGKDEEVSVIEICQSNPMWVYIEFKEQKGYVNGNYVIKM